MDDVLAELVIAADRSRHRGPWAPGDCVLPVRLLRLRL